MFCQMFTICTEQTIWRKKENLHLDTRVYSVNVSRIPLELACEQALYLGLTRDLFWARAASSRERIGAGSLAPKINLA